jgi:hypothetical protein
MSNLLFAPSRDLTTTRTKEPYWTTKTILTVFFTSPKLIVLEALSKGTRFTQHYFISDILPDLDSEKLKCRRKNPGKGFFRHMDNSKVTAQRRLWINSRRNT